MAYSETCKGWDVGVGAMGTVWNGVLNATGLGSVFGGLFPTSACAPGNVYIRERVTDERAGFGLPVALFTVAVAVFGIWAVLKLINALR